MSVIAKDELCSFCIFLNQIRADGQSPLTKKGPFERNNAGAARRPAPSPAVSGETDPVNKFKSVLVPRNHDERLKTKFAYIKIHLPCLSFFCISFCWPS